MKLANPLRHLRLIPAVLVLGTVLLGIKSAGLVMEARAQEQQQVQVPAAPAEPVADANDPAADDADTSSAQVDVLTSLAKRRAELDARERDLDMRDNLIAAAEKRVEAKIDSLKQLQTQIQTLLTQRDTEEQKQIAALVKAYSSMAPKDAARIFDSLNEEVLLAVAQAMKPADLAAVLAKMQPDAAQKLTVRLANRLKLPDPPPPAQVAQTLPPAATTAPPAAPAAAPAAAATAPAPGTAAPPAATTPKPTTPNK